MLRLRQKPICRYICLYILVSCGPCQVLLSLAMSVLLGAENLNKVGMHRQRSIISAHLLLAIKLHAFMTLPLSSAIFTEDVNKKIYAVSVNQN